MTKGAFMGGAEGFVADVMPFIHEYGFPLHKYETLHAYID